MLNELILLPDGDAIQAHNSDDAKVLGLLDVVLGTRPTAPTTIYKVSGDSASGVMGILFPDGRFLVKAQSHIGKHFVCRALAEEDTYAECIWDGAAPAASFTREDGTEGVEGTHGMLLGSYATRLLIERDHIRDTGKAGSGIWKGPQQGRSRGVTAVAAQGTLTASDPPSLRRAA